MRISTVSILTFCTVIVLLLSFQNAITATASTAEPAETPTAKTVKETKKCEPITLNLLAQYQADFYEEVATFMNSSEMVSAGLEDLEKTYFVTTSKILALRSTKLESPRNLDTVLKRGSLNTCNDIIVEVLEELDVVFQTAIKRTLGSKSSLMIVDKYDSINLKLRNLVDNMGALTNQVKSFDNQLRCFIDRCLF